MADRVCRVSAETMLRIGLEGYSSVQHTLKLETEVEYDSPQDLDKKVKALQQLLTTRCRAGADAAEAAVKSKGGGK
jgi:hypothetical protein